MTEFTHLHLHTHYSLLDGACRIPDLFDRAKQLGQTSVAITDHGVMYGVQEFYKTAKKYGIKPIIGCEVYVSPRSRFDKNHLYDKERYHLILLCKNLEGYHNLIKLISLSWTEGFYTKPRVDRELLEKYSDGLICLSGCMFGEVQSLILNNDIDSAIDAAVWHSSIFGDNNYYLELQNHGTREDEVVLSGLRTIHEKTGIPFAATNDVHYILKEDSEVQRVLVCIQTNKTINEDTGLDFLSDEFYLKSGSEMAELFKDYKDAVENTVNIANMCNVEFEYGVTKLPDFHIDENISHFEYLKRISHTRLSEKLGGEIPKEYEKRLNFELNVIDEMNFTDYFLIVADFIDFAVKSDIPVGPGRGSAAGSLAAYSMGITGVDPIKHGLLFERFLNPERISMPDIDIDFCYERRGEVIDYVINKYGADKVAQIITFGTMAARAAIRDVARALGLPYSLSDTVAKLIPHELNISIESSIKKSDELKKLYDNDENVKRIIDMAQKVEGMARHASTHAAGVVITKQAVSDYVPLAKNDDAVVTQYTMTEIEELGLLKIDFLGLRTLTVIKDAENLIKKHTPDFSIENISLDCPKVYTELQKGNTLGVFQCESQGMTNLIINLKPTRFEDVAAAIALYRPGPMFFIDSYIANRKDNCLIKYKTPLLKDILDETCGCMVYQEQVMQTFRTLAGYSFGRADVVRRAMSKKEHDVMEHEREIFINGLKDENGNVIVKGAVNQGIDKETANDIFSDMISFASYGFNKSHTAAYGLLAYRTAYLKTYYPKEFMAALLTSVLDDSVKISLYIRESYRIGIKVLPPHVNYSYHGFTVEGGDIRFGLSAIRNLGKAFIKKIIKTREAEPFQSFYDFCKRLYGGDFNKRAAESIVKCGALDNLGYNRREMLQNLPIILDSLEKERRQNLEGQLAFFSTDEESIDSELNVKPLTEIPKSQLLAFEKEVTGLYMSGHPLDEYEKLSKNLNCINIADIIGDDEDINENFKNGDYADVLGILTKIKKKVTKRDEIMAFADFEDATGAAELIIFPKTLIKYAPLFTEGNILFLNVKISKKNDGKINLIPETVKQVTDIYSAYENKDIIKSSENKNAKKRKAGLYLKLSHTDIIIEEKIKDLVSIFEGDMPVYLFFSNKNKYTFLGKDFLTTLNDPLISELKNLLGNENVIVWE
ncbi:MAG TPA: DNA polymerase III subunit alpha [Oscillospiraceae bacterium]|nr:DNA polymerase III subunit alpha [Oscillospiraceae bacterium]